MFKRWRRRRILARRRIPAEAWSAAQAALPVLHGLSDEESQRLRDLATLLLHEKAFAGAGGLELDQAMCVIIAAQACLPILNLGLDWYDGWSEIIVYPGGFVRDLTEIDQAGVIHQRSEAALGESWVQGPVVLSWEDAAQAGHADGVNLVIHELAHKLDMLNGDANGYPPLHRGMSPARWSQAFSAAFDDFADRVERAEQTAIDPYGASEPAEFFAVVSEVFFEAPDLLQHCYPDVFEQLRAFYRQDPRPRLSQ